MKKNSIINRVSRYLGVNLALSLKKILNNYLKSTSIRGLFFQ